jgi:hypothetical protein
MSRKFCISRQQKYRVAFLPVSVMMLEERQNQLCCVEPMMRGSYVKHNDNDGHVETGEQLPQVSVMKNAPKRLEHDTRYNCTLRNAQEKRSIDEKHTSEL